MPANSDAAGIRPTAVDGLPSLIGSGPADLAAAALAAGAPEAQAKSLLGDGGHALHRILTTQYNDGQKWILHYVTAREMFNIAMAAMEGRSGNPNDYRDHVVARPPVVTS